MSERGPFDELRDLIDEPVAPRQAFADQLRSRLMSELMASESLQQEHRTPMDAMIVPRPPAVYPIDSRRRLRPAIVLEIAAMALLVLGLAVALSNGWFRNRPEPPVTVPAAALQNDDTPTPLATSTTPTEVPVSTVAATVAPQRDIPEAAWILPGTVGDHVELGGLLAGDDLVFRLIASSSFVGVQAVDAKTGAIAWQQPHQWTGFLFAHDDDTLYFDGGNNRLVAMDANTGAEQWRAQVTGNPIAITEEDDRVFVLMDSDFVTALDRATGEQLWVAQGRQPQNPGGGSASIPAIGKIDAEDGVVAAVTTYGVLSGFDAATGQELWAHEGYDAATVYIDAEDDRFIVSFAMESAPGASSGAVSTANATPVAIEDVDIVNVAVVVGDCAGQIDGTAVTTGDSRIVTSGSFGAVTFIIQEIDPQTGAIRSERDSGGECILDAQAGQGMSGATAQNVIVIGSISGDPLALSHLVEDDGDMIVLGAIAGLDEAPIAVVVDDDAAFLQLADGTLIRVAAHHSSSDDGDHEDRDDDDHDDDESHDSDRDR